MKKVKLGVIGCGAIAQKHLSAAVKIPQVEVVSVADLREESARSTAEKFKIPHWTVRAQDIFDDPEVQAVVLALPACVRTELGKSAFNKGKHVLFEKPVAMNSSEVEHLIKAQGNLVGACCSARFRFLKSAKFAAEFMASGVLGPLRQIRIRAVLEAGPHPDKIRAPWALSRKLNGGGVLVNWGSYDFDFIFGVTGWTLKPLSVSGHTWLTPGQFASRIAPDSDGESHVTALIRLNDDIMLSYERGEQFQGKTDQNWEIIGEKGVLHLWMGGGNPVRITHDDTTSQDGVISKVIWEEDDSMQDVHTRLLSDFVDAILERKQPYTSLRNALTISKLTDSIYESSQTRKTVEIL